MEAENVRLRSSALSSRENFGCDVLQDKYNERIFDQLGDKCNTLVTGVAQLLVENLRTWDTLCSGAICYVKDRQNKKYSLRLIDYDSSNLSSEKWRIDLPTDQEFELTCRANLVYITFTTSEGKHYKLIFTSKTDAEKFFNTAEQLQSERRAKEASRRTSWFPFPLKRESKTENEADKDEKRKTQLSKLDIGLPKDFVHVLHMGSSTLHGSDSNDEIANSSLRVGVTEARAPNTPLYVVDSDVNIAASPVRSGNLEAGFAQSPLHTAGSEAEVRKSLPRHRISMVDFASSPLTTEDAEGVVMMRPMRSVQSAAEVAKHARNSIAQMECSDASETDTKRMQPRIPTLVGERKVPTIVRRNTAAVLTELESAVLRRNHGLDRKSSDNVSPGSDSRPRPKLLPKPREAKPPLLYPKPKLARPPPLLPKPMGIRAMTTPEAAQVPIPPTRIGSRGATVAVSGHPEGRVAATGTGNAPREHTATTAELGTPSSDITKRLRPNLSTSDTSSNNSTRRYDGRELVREQNVHPGGLSPIALNATTRFHSETEDSSDSDTLRLSRSPFITLIPHLPIENLSRYRADAPSIRPQSCLLTEVPLPALVAVASCAEASGPHAVEYYEGAARTTRSYMGTPASILNGRVVPPGIIDGREIPPDPGVINGREVPSGPGVINGREVPPGPGVINGREVPPGPGIIANVPVTQTSTAVKSAKMPSVPCSTTPFSNGSWVRVDFLNHQRYGVVRSIGTVLGEEDEGNVESAAIEIEGTLPEEWPNALELLCHVAGNLRLCSSNAVALVPLSSLSEVHVYGDVQESGLETTIEEQISLAGEMGYTSNDFMEALCSEFRKGARGPFSSIDEMIDALCYVQAIHTVTSSHARGTAEVEGIAEGGLELKAEKSLSDEQQDVAYEEVRRLEQRMQELTTQLDNAKSELNKIPSCAICLDARPQIVFEPCLHFNCCEACASKIGDCPICRRKILDRIKVYQ